MERSREYWQERFKELEEARNDFAEDVFTDISGEYDRAIQRLDNELSYWYQRYAFDNEISYQEAKKLLNSKELKQFKTDLKTFIAKAKEASLSEEWQKRLENAYLRMRVSRIEAIQLILQQHLEELFGNQLDQLDKKLKELYTEDYNHTVFNIQQGAGIGSSFIGVDTNKLDTVLSKPWADDGKNFSSRIWEHKTNLVTLLNKELLQAVIRGDDYQTATNNIAHKMNVSRANAGRLVMTEAAFIGTRAQKDCFTNLGVEEYEFVATLDRRTSPICRSMDGKHFKMSDMKIGTNAPPLHPRCRSCTAPYFEDADDLARVARGDDGKTYKVPANTTYEQWTKRIETGRIKANKTDKFKKGLASGNVIAKNDTSIAVKISDISYEDDNAVQMMFKQFADNMLPEKVEHAFVATKNNELIWVQGSVGSVDITLLGKALKGAKVIHNHPTTDYGIGDSFSREDIAGLLEYSLKYLEVVSELGRYRVSYKGKNLTPGQVKDLYADALSKVRNKAYTSGVNLENEQLETMKYLNDHLDGLSLEEL